MQKEFKTDWNKLNNLNDNEIDYSDIPETGEEFWQSADYVVPRKKVDITLKIDEDLALWLKSMGQNSNQAVNNLIRAFYLVKN